MISHSVLGQSIDGAKRESQTLVIMAKTPKHEFGGPWTEVKLDAISEYLDFYRNALKNRDFETWYVDAFAGTGERNAKVTRGGIFEDAPLEEVEEVLAGSAKRALQITPPFAHYWFSEQRPTRVKALEALREEFDSDIIVRRGDAGEQLRELFSSPPWSNHRDHWKQRAVVFVDPYGNQAGGRLVPFSPEGSHPAVGEQEQRHRRWQAGESNAHFRLRGLGGPLLPGAACPRIAVWRSRDRREHSYG